MKRITLLFTLSCLSVIVKAQQFNYKPSSTVLNCGGFILDSLKVDKSLPGKTLIYGKIIRCSDKELGAGAVVEVLNESSKVIDTCYADISGKYKIIIPTGTYEIWAARASFGEIKTTAIDFVSQTSIKLDLYLSIPPDIKD